MNKEVLKKSAEHSRTESDRALAIKEVTMTFIEKAVTKTAEKILFGIIVPAACVAVKGRRGLREVTSRRKEEQERRQKEAASKENK